MRILRARNAGTGSGGAGNPRPVSGVMHGTRDDTMGDKDSPGMLRAYASMRDRARRAIQGTSIGSRGRL